MLSKKIQSLKPSPTLLLTALAQKLKSQGHDVINLSAGQPDWQTFPNVVEKGIHAIQEGFTRYTPAAGISQLRDTIAQNYKRQLQIDYQLENVTVSTGSKFVLFSALQSVLDSGDEVIVPVPYWVSYPEMIRLADGHPVMVGTQAKNHFKLTADDLEQALTPKTKVLLLNSPSNPTGESYSREELTALATVLKKHKQVLVFSDDIYNQLFFGDSDYAPHILKAAPDLQDRTLILNGVSKTYAMTGWRLGWGIGPTKLIKAMTSFQSQSVSCAVSFCQKAAVEALTNTASHLKATLAELKDRRDFAYQIFNETAGISLHKPSGGLYLWLDISAYLQQGQFEGSRDFCQKLLEKEKVAIVPGKEFGQEGYVRIIFALQKKHIIQAHKRFSNFLEQTK